MGGYFSNLLEGGLERSIEAELGVLFRPQAVIEKKRNNTFSLDSFPKIRVQFSDKRNISKT